MNIAVQVPSLLRGCTRGYANFTLEAETLQEAHDLLLSNYPLLRIHLYSESGELRRQGDRFIVFQAVFGG